VVLDGHAHTAPTFSPTQPPPPRSSISLLRFPTRHAAEVCDRSGKCVHLSHSPPLTCPLAPAGFKRDTSLTSWAHRQFKAVVFEPAREALVVSVHSLITRDREGGVVDRWVPLAANGTRHCHPAPACGCVLCSWDASEEAQGPRVLPPCGRATMSCRTPSLYVP
jgi:hypothetical protein